MHVCVHLSPNRLNQGMTTKHVHRDTGKYEHVHQHHRGLFCISQENLASPISLQLLSKSCTHAEMCMHIAGLSASSRIHSHKPASPLHHHPPFSTSSTYNAQLEDQVHRDHMRAWDPTDCPGVSVRLLCCEARSSSTSAGTACKAAQTQTAPCD